MFRFNLFCDGRSIRWRSDFTTVKADAKKMLCTNSVNHSLNKKKEKCLENEVGKNPEFLPDEAKAIYIINHVHTESLTAKNYKVLHNFCIVCTLMTYATF